MVLIASCGNSNNEEVEKLTMGTYTLADDDGNHTSEEKNYEHIWDNELDTLPKLQKEFVLDIVKAYRTANQELGFSRLHSSVLAHPRCSKIWSKKFSRPKIKEQYAVKVEPGEKPDSLYFSIRHQNKGEDSKRNFLQMKYVVLENDKLVINMNCEAAFKMMDNMRNFKEWKNNHKCGEKITYDDGMSMKSANGVSSEKPVEGADLYEYCLNSCKKNVELNSKNMKSYQCYINDIEIEKSPQKLAWDQLNEKGI